jgi:uncharacterized SAM-binding protein YcdF (DUF218 family)
VFWLKKAVSFWLMPLPLCVALLVAGVLLLGLSSRQRLGRWLAMAAAVLLIVFSSNFVSIRILRPLERRYPAIPEFGPDGAAAAAVAGCRYVAVLGSGHSPMPGVSATGQLTASGLSRLVEAVRILRALPDAQLIVSGPGRPGERSHAAVLAAGAESLGISASRITLVDTAHDTEEEAQAVATLARGARTALVTSAWHMPRAAHLFLAAGVNFVPCPADFVARSDPDFRLTGLRIDSESLGRSTLAVHEWVGLAWLRLREAL